MTKELKNHRLLSLVIALTLVFSCAVRVSLAAQETPAYRLVGLENGDTVVVNEAIGNTVTIVDESQEVVNNPSATATNVSMVEFYVNDLIVSSDATSPYTYTLPNDVLGTVTLKAVVYDTLSGTTTLTRSYKAVEGVPQTTWSENFEGTNPVLLKNTVSYFNGATLDHSGNTQYATGDVPWEVSVASNTLSGSKAQYMYSGNYYISTLQGSTTKLNTYGFNIALWHDELDIESAMNRLFFEFDFVGNYYSALNCKSICLRDGFKNEKETEDYGQLPLPPVDILKNTSGNNNLKCTHLAYDISWDVNTKRVSYKLYVDGMEYTRGIVLGTKGVEPSNLTAVLSGVFPLKVPYYIDNIRVATYADKSMLITSEPSIAIYDENDALLSPLTDIDADSAAYMTIDVDGGIDTSTTSGAVKLTDTVSGDELDISVSENKIIFPALLRQGTEYELILGTAVKNLAGKGFAGPKTVSFTTKSPTIVADRAATGFGASALPAIGSSGTVSFDAKMAGTSFSGKTVNVVVAVYHGSDMVSLVVSPQAVPATGILTPVTVTIAEMKEGMVVEAFIVDNMNTLSTVTEKVYVLK